LRSSRQKTLLLIIPSLVKGGAEKVLLDQYAFYATHAKTVGCVFNWDFVTDEKLKSSFISLDVPAGKNFLQKIYYFFLRIKRLRQLKKQHHVDISISHLEGADYVNILSRRRERIICWIHGTKRYDGNISGLIGWIRKNILMPWLYNRRTNTIITVSEGIREELLAFFGLNTARVRTMYNGFDLKAIKGESAESPPWVLQTLAEGKAILFTHCRLARQKNLAALLHIVARVKQTRAVSVFIVGDGDLKEQLYGIGEELGLRQYAAWKDPVPYPGCDVYFLGHHDNPFSLLRQATLFVMTSSWEGFPLALCEAMACEIPVIAADCYTGPREIIAPELTRSQPLKEPYASSTGMLMPLAEEQNFDQWETAIVELLSNESLRAKLSKSGMKRIEDFDKTNVVKEWLTLLYE